MRNAVVGAILGAALIAALFGVAHFHPARLKSVVLPRPVTIQSVAGDLPRNFVGVRWLGAWRLTCAKLPVGAKRANSKAPSLRPPRCRVGLLLQGSEPDQLLSMAFVLAGPNRTMMLTTRTPPSANSAAGLTLRLNSGDLKFPIDSCSPVCLSFWNVPARDVQKISAADKAILILPPDSIGQSIGVNIPLAGLPAAIAALEKIDR